MVDQRELRNQVFLDSEGQDFTIFTEEEVQRALKEIKNKKAPGYNGIKAETLKRMLRRVLGTIMDLCNKMLMKGTFLNI